MFQHYNLLIAIVAVSVFLCGLVLNIVTQYYNFYSHLDKMNYLILILSRFAAIINLFPNIIICFVFFLDNKNVCKYGLKISMVLYIIGIFSKKLLFHYDTYFIYIENVKVKFKIKILEMLITLDFIGALFFAVLLSIIIGEKLDQQFIEDFYCYIQFEPNSICFIAAGYIVFDLIGIIFFSIDIRHHTVNIHDEHCLHAILLCICLLVSVSDCILNYPAFGFSKINRTICFMVDSIMLSICTSIVLIYRLKKKQIQVTVV